MSRVKEPPTTEVKGPRVERRQPKAKRQAPRAAKSAQQPVAAEPAAAGAARRQLALGAMLLLAAAWAYWPTLVEIVSAWNREPDYSHGFLVVPVAIYFLWVRRERCPGMGSPAYVLGAALIGLSLLARYVGARFYFGFVDGYSILPWLAGVVAIGGGRRMLLWTLPSIGFLFFMIPLPFGIETAMSMPLQRLATKISCVALQLLGQPAFAEGNVILLGSQQLEVAQACSGLRLFASVIALAYAYIVLVRRAWWEKAVLLAAVAPIAIASNATRIVATGLLYEFTTGETAHKIAHDFSGWAMIPLAASLFGLVLWYLGKLIEEEEVLDVGAMMREVRV